MALNYAYNYAYIDPNTNMCMEVRSMTDNSQSEYPNWIEIPVYDEDYICKYYIDGNWYEDAEGTIPWQSSLL